MSVTIRECPKCFRGKHCDRKNENLIHTQDVVLSVASIFPLNSNAQVWKPSNCSPPVDLCQEGDQAFASNYGDDDLCQEEVQEGDQAFASNYGDEDLCPDVKHGYQTFASNYGDDDLCPDVKHGYQTFALNYGDHDLCQDVQHGDDDDDEDEDEDGKEQRLFTSIVVLERTIALALNAVRAIGEEKALQEHLSAARCWEQFFSGQKCDGFEKKSDDHYEHRKQLSLKFESISDFTGGIAQEKNFSGYPIFNRNLNDFVLILTDPSSCLPRSLNLLAGSIGSLMAIKPFGIISFGEEHYLNAPLDRLVESFPMDIRGSVFFEMFSMEIMTMHWGFFPFDEVTVECVNLEQILKMLNV